MNKASVPAVSSAMTAREKKKEEKKKKSINRKCADSSGDRACALAQGS